MTIITILDLLGTFVFAISGSLVARNREFDIFGALVVAFATALGGGTIRDLLIGVAPVGWMLDAKYLVAVIAGVGVAAFFSTILLKLRKTLFLFDTIGIGIFTLIGIQKALAQGLSPGVALMMGIVSAVFGGVVRDILCNEVPLIFRKEIYATACLAGGTIYLVGIHLGVNNTVAMVACMLLIIGIRLISVMKKIALPKI
ncbi:trimeric intracellular cation channel family protein [Williamwhitmania taraxaci]|uniref:Uncharacterized membrane protein YeiH n=1 Tax=Williamwhitmania taraxaci TaxID=1640674 RepID=A0A1G6RXH7_9BACT|nr:trimeric intracellular cation channel family protein [Williamwhitmania taraxaci]SDD09289.1 Uncharacterized membrane protein YeiH [Williamwhitmania taraxaci]